MRSAVKRIGGLLLVLVAVAAIVVSTRRPSLDREWDEDVRVLTGVEREPDGTILLTAVRDWRYTRDAVVAKSYVPVLVEPTDLQGLWLYEQELGLGGRIAHTFLVFELPASYAPTRWLGLSVETRREVGENYSLLGGMLRKFELTHTWATEEDLVRRRVEMLDYSLTRYRVAIANDAVARIFERFADETAALATTPRWYHTLTTNCTNSLVDYVNRTRPGAIPWHYSFILTGRADGYLERLGYLDPGSAQPITRDWLAQHALRDDQ